MKKIILLCFIVFVLFGCSTLTYQISLSDTTIPNLYVPEFVKNNASFLGFEVISNINFNAVTYKKDDVDNGMVYTNQKIYPKITYDLLKNFVQNKQLYLKAIYEEYEIEELFKFTEIDDTSCVVGKTDIFPYPREISIPSEYLNMQVSEIEKFGFFGLDNLIFVNLPSTIKYINNYAFANTSLYRINQDINADDTAFYNTILSGQDFKKIHLNLIENEYKKIIKINDLELEVIIDLNGGKIIKEELDLVVHRPILENEIFDSFENEEGRKIKIENDYKIISLKDYYKHFVGLEYKINSRKITNDIYYFSYLKDSDSYSLALIDEGLELSRLILPDTYQGKKITRIETFNNKHVSELVLGKFVEEIKCEFRTPNLRLIRLPETLKKIKPYAFSGTLLTSINLPKSMKRLEAGVFSYTFIKNYTIEENIEYIDGSCFSRCLDIRFKSNNPIFIISSDNRRVYYENKKCLLLYSNTFGFQVIDLEGVEIISSNTFSYFMIKELRNYENLKKIEKLAFYNARIIKMFELEAIENIHELAFLKFDIQNN